MFSRENYGVPQRRVCDNLFSTSLAAVAILSSLPGLLCCHSATAQQPAPAATKPIYRELPVAEAYAVPLSRDRNDLRRKAMEALTTEPLTDEGKKSIDAWFTQVEFREMTHIDQLQTLPDRRRLLFLTSFLRSARAVPNLAPHAHLRELTTKWMVQFADTKNNLHPAVQLNAMLILGDLNKKERDVNTGVPITPDYDILTMEDGLMAVVKDPQRPSALRIAAMVGILRHLRESESMPVQNATDKMPAATNKAVADLLLLFVKLKKPDATMTLDGHQWLRGQALEGFGTLAISGGPTNSVSKEVAAVLGEKDLPLYVRCIAADTFGKLAFTGPKGLDTTQVAKDLGRLALDIISEETKKAEEGNRDVSMRRIVRQSFAVHRALDRLSKIPQLAPQEAVTNAELAETLGETAATREEGAALTAFLDKQQTTLRGILDRNNLLDKAGSPLPVDLPGSLPGN